MHVLFQNCCILNGIFISLLFIRSQKQKKTESIINTFIFTFENRKNATIYCEYIFSCAYAWMNRIKQNENEMQWNRKTTAKNSAMCPMYNVGLGYSIAMRQTAHRSIVKLLFILNFFGRQNLITVYWGSVYVENTDKQPRWMAW